MGRPKKGSLVEGKAVQHANKIRGEKWTQSEMETLASLCVLHGRSGILSKETNKATTAKKDSQWSTVQSVFNSMHPPRDKSALLARFKYILMYLRKDNAQERRNNVQTGGGPRAANDEKMPFEVTGPMTELAGLLGVSISGLDGFGSDASNILTDNELQNSSTGLDENQLIDLTHNNQYTFEKTIKDHWENLVNDGTKSKIPESVNEGEKSQVNDNDLQPQVELPTTESDENLLNDVDLPTTPFSGRVQFFPTASQRRPTKRKASSTNSLTEIRKEYLAERDRREKEKHAAEMHYEKAIMEAKLGELHKNALDQQVERERRAELHEMEIRHKESIFNHQIKMMTAACNAFDSSSREVALGSIISLAMENTRCFPPFGHKDETETV